MGMVYPISGLESFCWGCNINITGGYAEPQYAHDLALHEAFEKAVRTRLEAGAYQIVGRLIHLGTFTEAERRASRVRLKCAPRKALLIRLTCYDAPLDKGGKYWGGETAAGIQYTIRASDVTCEKCKAS